MVACKAQPFLCVVILLPTKNKADAHTYLAQVSWKWITLPQGSMPHVLHGGIGRELGCLFVSLLLLADPKLLFKLYQSVKS